MCSTKVVQNGRKYNSMIGSEEAGDLATWPNGELGLDISAFGAGDLETWPNGKHALGLDDISASSDPGKVRV